MQVLTTIKDYRLARRNYPTLGLVPTMGYLHDGHLSLVRRAKAECGSVAVSIFVNPTQFGPKEDFSRYPRDLQRDLSMLSEAGADIVFAPTVEEMYPNGNATVIDVQGVSAPLEGMARPGHFRGVATVVAKLLNICQPTKSYFGQKDIQQTIVIQRMVDDLNIPVEIIVCPTVRESDGLAMSSRNVYLNPEERQTAAAIFRALNAAETSYRIGETSADALRRIMKGTLAAENKISLEYASVADPTTLRELQDANSGAVLSIAARIGKTRLIDNLVLHPHAASREQPTKLVPMPALD